MPKNPSFEEVRRDVVYKAAGETRLLMDVYSPGQAVKGTRLPAIIFIHGGPVANASPSCRRPTWRDPLDRLCQTPARRFSNLRSKGIGWPAEGPRGAVLAASLPDPFDDRRSALLRPPMT
jgi:hypothetical protein